MGTVSPLPNQEAEVAAQLGGRLTELRVKRGDRVKAGQVVASVYSDDLAAATQQAAAARQAAQQQARAASADASSEREKQEAALREAEAALKAAQARLAKSKAGPLPQEIAAAKAELAAEQATLDKLQHGTRPEEVAQAEASVRAAEAEWAKLKAGSRPQEIAAGEAAVRDAEAQGTTAKKAQERAAKLFDDGLASRKEKEEAEANAAAAQARLDQAKEQLKLLKEGTRKEEIAAQEAKVREAKAALDLAKAGFRVFKPFYNEADLLHDSLASLRDAILIGALLGIVVLFLFLRSTRGTLVVLLCLPLTVLISFLVLKLFHQTLNIMTLGALAVGLGLMIDDVVVTMENIFRHAEAGAEAETAALEGTFEIQKPMIGSSFTSMAVFAPLAFLTGITGAFFAPLSITLAVLLIVSVVLAVTIVPLVCSRFVGRRAETGAESGGVLGWVREAAYPAVMSRALGRPWLVVVAAALVVGAAGFVFVRLPTGFMPEMDEGAFVFDYLAPSGLPVEETDRAMRIVEAEMRKTPEISSYARRTGLRLAFAMAEPNQGGFSVKLKPRSQRKRHMTEIMEDVQGRCQALLPGVTMEAVAPLGDRVSDIAGVPSQVEVKVFGDDPDVLADLAVQIREVIADVPGTTESVHELNRSGPELSIRLDPKRCALLGLTPAQVIDQLETAMLGRADTTIRSGERLIGVRVLYPPAFRRTAEQVRSLPIMGADGKVTPIESLADITENPGFFVVTRENQRPMIPVTSQIEGRDLGGVNEEVKARVSREVKLLPGYAIEYGGLYQTQQESFRSLLTVMTLGLFLVFMVLVWQYRAYAEAIALLITGVCSLSGAVFALRLAGTPFNASSFTGLIMILGLALTNGIYLMDMVRLRQEQDGESLDTALLEAGKLRVRPILMTGGIAVLTLLPLAFGIGAGAEMQQPLAVACIGGFLFAALFTLVLAPTLLYLLKRNQPSPAAQEVAS